MPSALVCQLMPETPQVPVEAPDFTICVSKKRSSHHNTKKGTSDRILEFVGYSSGAGPGKDRPQGLQLSTTLVPHELGYPFLGTLFCAMKLMPETPQVPVEAPPDCTV